MFCALSGRSLSWNTPVFCRFTAREHAKLLFIIMCFDPYHSKARAPKVLWEKGIFRRSKELNSDLRSCPLVWAPCWKFEWRHHVSSSGPDWRKRKSKEEERRRGKKKAMVALFIFIIWLLWREFLAEKMLLNGKGPFAGNLFINRLEDSAMNSANLQNVPFWSGKRRFTPFGIDAVHFADPSSRFCSRLVCWMFEINYSGALSRAQRSTMGNKIW